MGQVWSTLSSGRDERATRIHLALTFCVTLACYMQRKRLRVTAVLLWTLFHALVHLPLQRLFNLLCGGSKPPFSWRAQACIDTTRMIFDSLPLSQTRAVFLQYSRLVNWVVRPDVSPVQPSDRTFAQKLEGSLWYGNADINEGLGVILYFHGGGFCMGGANMWCAGYMKLIHAASRNGVALRVLSVEYPLACERKTKGDTPLDTDINDNDADAAYGSNGFQNAIETCVAAFDYLQEELGIPAHNIVFAGDSAGGTLCLATSLLLRERARRVLGLGAHATSQQLRAQLPAALALISPGPDLSENARWRTRHQPHDPHAQPAYDFLTLHALEEFGRWYGANSRNDARARWTKGERGWQTGEDIDHFSASAATAASASAALSSDGIDSTHSSRRSSCTHLEPPPAITLSHPLISPVYANLSSLPPCLISVGQREILSADIERLHSALRDAQVEVTLQTYEEGTHNYVLTPEAFGAISDSHLQDIGAFIAGALTHARARNVTNPSAALARNLFSTANFVAHRDR